MSQAGFFFYTGDWLKDTRCLSLEARGAWIDLLCALHEAGGSITWPLRAFDQYWGTIERDGIVYSASEILAELAQLNICSVVTHGDNLVTVESRRIKRDANYKESHRKRQERYRQKRSGDARVTKVGDGSSSSESSSLISIKNHKNDSSPRSQNFPDEWKWLENMVRAQNSGFPIERFLDFAWWDAVSYQCGGLSAPFLEKELAGMKRWIMDNPTRTPTPRGYRKFVAGWLERAHDKERRFK